MQTIFRNWSRDIHRKRKIIQNDDHIYISKSIKLSRRPRSWIIINFYYSLIFFQRISPSIVRAQIYPTHKHPPRFNIRNRDRCNAKQEKPRTSTRPVSSSNWYTAFFNFIPLFPPRRGMDIEKRADVYNQCKVVAWSSRGWRIDIGRYMEGR